MTKLQQVEKTLTDMGESLESIANVRAKMTELRTKANGGVEHTRSQKARSLLQQKNNNTKSKKWLRKQMMDFSKQLYKVNK
eukprot:16293142-Heterocapsa_arctica.AAC.1